MRRRTAAILTVAVLTGTTVVTMAPRASASTTYTWKGDGDAHSWGQNSNWDPAGTPQDGDSVVIGPTQVTDSPHVIGVPTISLDSFTMSGGATNGPTLTGGTSIITVKTLQWSQGTIEASLVVTDGGQMLATGVEAPKIPPTLSSAATPGGAPPASLTNNGVIAQSGTFGLASGQGGARIFNEGSWLAGPGTIKSSNCCVDPGTFVNNGVVTMAGDSTIDHGRFQAQPGSLVNGSGTLRMFGGVPELNGPWKVFGGVTLRLTDGAKATIGGTTTIGGTLRQESSSEIRGNGVFAGMGRYLWQGGRIYGGLTLSSSLETDISGTDIHEVSDSIGTGTLTNEGKVTQNNHADVLMNGTILNKGTWNVPSGDTATIQAGGCCVAPKKFRNAGTISVKGDLTLGLLEYSNPPNAGVIEGGGLVRLDNGIHQLRDGGAVRGEQTTLALVNQAEVHGSGTLTINGALTMAGATLRDTFTIGGTGKAILASGTISADLTTGPNLTVRPKAVSLDAINGQGILRTEGHVVHAAAASFRLVGPARILNGGTWDMQHAAFEGTGCCANPARFVNEGTVVIKPEAAGDTAATFSLARFVNRGTTEVDQTAVFHDLSPVQEDGRMKLAHGSRVQTDEPLQVTGGVLQGEGIIKGDLRNGGIVSPGTGSDLGTISILGAYRQLGSARLDLDEKASQSDLIVADALHLAGLLSLGKLGAGPLGPGDRVLLLGTHPRTGTFDTVLGLGSLGGGRRVQYTPTSVRLDAP